MSYRKRELKCDDFVSKKKVAWNNCHDGHMHYWKCDIKQNGIEEKIPEESIHPVLPVLSKLPCRGSRTCVDVYSVFRFKPMHSIATKVRKMLKECIVFMLGYVNRTNRSMRFPNESEFF